MSFEEDQYIAYINNLAAQINRYFSIFIFIFGTAGNILNIMVFSRRTFRKNPCAILFLSSSIANLIALFSGLTSRMLSGWAADLTNTDRFLCKFRAFILNVARAIAFWLILLASIDRWLISTGDVRRRALSTLKNAIKCIIIVSISSTIIFSQILYCYEPNLINSPLKCYGMTLACRFVTDICFTFLIIVSPIFLMFVFGLMTINNVHHSRDRVQTTNQSHVTTAISTVDQHRRHRAKIDTHLLLMLLTQVALLFIFGLPLGIQKLYATITATRSSSKAQVAIDNFVYGFVLLLNFLANGMPFYIYTLVGGHIFRKALVQLFFDVKRKVLFQ